jgi:hypothetical protein
MLKHASQDIRDPNTPNSTCSVRAAGIVQRFRKPQTYGMPAARTGCRKKIKAG